MHLEKTSVGGEQSEAIRSTQKQSEAIGSHQKPSEAIRSNQKHLEKTSVGCFDKPLTQRRNIMPPMPAPRREGRAAVG